LFPGTSGRQTSEANPTGRRNFCILCQAWGWPHLRTRNYKITVSRLPHAMSDFI
jgi:hypothetical protein